MRVIDNTELIRDPSSSEFIRPKAGARKPRPEHRLAAIAAKQHGVFSRAQARAVGVTPGVECQRLALGRWEKLFAGVYRLAGSPRTWRQDVFAACMAWGSGAVASHRSAAALWAFAGFMCGPLELTIPRNRRRGVAGIVHRPVAPLKPMEVTHLDNIPVTTPMRTLLDVAALENEVLEEALDDALRRRLVSVSRTRRYVRDVSTNGRPGAVALRRLIEARGDAPIPQSPLETRVLRLLSRAGLKPPRRQYPIRDRTGPVAVVDFAYPEQRVAVEADGYAWHTGRRRWSHDLTRRNTLTSNGWRVIHVTPEDLHAPGRVLEHLTRALAR